MDDKQPPIIYDNEASLRTNERGGIIAGVINLVFGFILAVVALRIVFVLLGANAANGLVDTVYGLSAPFVAPFAGIFGATEAGLAQSRIDVPAIVALLVYGLLAALINGAVGYNHRRATL